MEGRREGRLLRISSRGGKLRPTKVDSASSSFFSSLLCEKHPTTLAFPGEKKEATPTSTLFLNASLKIYYMGGKRKRRRKRGTSDLIAG